jgi:hypothetical protein
LQFHYRCLPFFAREKTQYNGGTKYNRRLHKSFVEWLLSTLHVNNKFKANFMFHKPLLVFSGFSNEFSFLCCHIQWEKMNDDEFIAFLWKVLWKHLEIDLKHTFSLATVKRRLFIELFALEYHL